VDFAHRIHVAIDACNLHYNRIFFIVYRMMRDVSLRL